MPIQNFTGHTFVAFIDISGFKELMKNDQKALAALKQFYQSGYNALSEIHEVEGFFVSDCGILFARTGTINEKLSNLLSVIKIINLRMLENDYMLTTSVSYGHFDYQDKLEFDGIEKNQIYGNAYVQAFLDNETGTPKIQPGQCRIITENIPDDLTFPNDDFPFIKQKGTHLYYYWNVNSHEEIDNFETEYNDSYKLKYSGMLKALKMV